MNFGSQILIFDAVGFFAALNNTCISDRTIALLLSVLTEDLCKKIVLKRCLLYCIMFFYFTLNQLQNEYLNNVVVVGVSRIRCTGVRTECVNFH